MGYKLTGAYIGTQKVRPKTLQFTYSYDFRNKTWATCQTDGWTVTGGQTPSVGSDGIYYNGWYSNVANSVFDATTASKITASVYYKAPSNFDGLGLRLLKMPGDSNRCGVWISSTNRQIQIDGTTVQTITQSKPSAGWHTQDFVFDLENKTYSFTGEFSASGTLTDANVTTIKTLNSFGMALDYSYIGTVDITIEY